MTKTRRPPSSSLSLHNTTADISSHCEHPQSKHDPKTDTSSFEVLFTLTGGRKRKTWSEGRLTVSAEKAMVVCTESSVNLGGGRSGQFVKDQYVCGCKAASPSQPCSAFQVMSRNNSLFEAGDIFEGNLFPGFTVQVEKVLHLHLHMLHAEAAFTFGSVTHPEEDQNPAANDDTTHPRDTPAAAATDGKRSMRQGDGYPSKKRKRTPERELHNRSFNDGTHYLQTHDNRAPASQPQQAFSPVHHITTHNKDLSLGSSMVPPQSAGAFSSSSQSTTRSPIMRRKSVLLYAHNVISEAAVGGSREWGLLSTDREQDAEEKGSPPSISSLQQGRQTRSDAASVWTQQFHSPTLVQESKRESKLHSDRVHVWVVGENSTPPPQPTDHRHRTNSEISMALKAAYPQCSSSASSPPP